MGSRLITARLLAPAAAICALFAAPALASAETVRPLPKSDYATLPVCGAPTPRHDSCLASRLVPLTAAARAHLHPIGVPKARVLSEPTPQAGDFGLRPTDLHHAYLLPRNAPEGTKGERETVAIVDAYNDPEVGNDLEKYSETFGLPACNKTNGCLRVLNEHGSEEESMLPFPKSKEELREAGASSEESEAIRAGEAESWDVEISLDVETVHGTCQNCNIVLVEAGSEESKELFEAEGTAESLEPTAITNSWGGPEETKEKTEDETAPFYDKQTVITAAAGDEGYLGWDTNRYEENCLQDELEELSGHKPTWECAPHFNQGPYFPASSPNVVAVGGTHLKLSSSTGGWQEEAVWNGEGAGGGGCSILFEAPEWQKNVSDWSNVGCKEQRAVADVSADASPESGLAVYDTDGECESRGVDWCTIGGTSLASPLIAATFALAGGTNGTEYPAKVLYENLSGDAASLHDITAGSNGACKHLFECSIAKSETEEAKSCKDAAICVARPGYDGPTGVGTPDGISAFKAGSTSGETATEQGEQESEDLAIRREEEKAEREAQERTTTTVTTPKKISITALALTPRATAALHSRKRHGRTIAFTLRASTSGRVRVRLYRLVRDGRRYVWRATRASRIITVKAGENSSSLTTAASLRAGKYLLRLTPVSSGRGRSLQFTAG